MRTSDLEWWNGVSLDECKAFEKQDNVAQIATLTHFMEDDHLSEEEAAKKVRLLFPFYYWTLEQRTEEHFQIAAADAKLPYVLKERVNRAVTSGRIDRATLNRTSSMNGLVRELIQSGRL